MGKNLEDKGVPYNSIKAKHSFQGGNMKINQLSLNSPAFELNANGDVDLVKQRLGLDADVAFLNTIDKILGFIPLVGDTAARFTYIYLNVQGPLDDPKVSVRRGKVMQDKVRRKQK